MSKIGDEGDTAVIPRRQLAISQDPVVLVALAQKKIGITCGAISMGRVTGNERREERPAGLEHAIRLCQRLSPLGFLQQMIERPHQQHGVELVVREATQIERGALHEGQRDARLGRLFPRQRQVAGRQIEQHNLVPLARQLDRVASRPATAIQHTGWRSGQIFVQRAQCDRELGAMAVHPRPLGRGVRVIEALNCQAHRVGRRG